eukprot:TRINITY_DN172_c0_g1_i3.p1 TRINITY_DN172_c0_g1~~TRINITY_DN172_c0_g1_i3.p1  ORF type:complete len:381 (-),score=41.55 TRINITY_DN172_c0_g1_i3:735-1877(-)
MSRPVTQTAIPQLVQDLKNSFRKGITRTLEWRISQLRSLKRMLLENRDEIIGAVQKDLGKAVVFEVIGSEINIPLSELDDTLHNLKDWASPKDVTTNLVSIPATSQIVKDPVGTVLIISPWNYPVNLAIVPLIGAIAAGNTVFLKLSRHSAHTGKTLEKLLVRYMDNGCIKVESAGGAPMITTLLIEKWDHIFFTGSVSVGKVVYEAAAKFLTPCTLELGGKNPCIVDHNTDIDFVAKRLVWGKFWNCGQTCIAPDYILVLKDVEEELIKSLKKYIHHFHGPDPEQSTSFCRVISIAALKRLIGLLKCGTVAEGGNYNEKSLYMAPTIIKNVDVHSELMTEEIFGPILPVIPVGSVDEAIVFMYFFLDFVFYWSRFFFGG